MAGAAPSLLRRKPVPSARTTTAPIREGGGDRRTEARGRRNEGSRSGPPAGRANAIEEQEWLLDMLRELLRRILDRGMNLPLPDLIAIRTCAEQLRAVAAGGGVDRGNRSTTLANGNGSQAVNSNKKPFLEQSRGGISQKRQDC